MATAIGREAERERCFWGDAGGPGDSRWVSLGLVLKFRGFDRRGQETEAERWASVGIIKRLRSRLELGSVDFLDGEVEVRLVDGEVSSVLELISGKAGDREGFDKDPHATAQTEDEMECGLLLDGVVGKGTTIL